MTTKYTIHKLDCHSCSMMIEGISEDTAGVKKAEVNSRQRVLVVEHDETFQAVSLQQALGDQGYPVEILK